MQTIWAKFNSGNDIFNDINKKNKSKNTAKHEQNSYIRNGNIKRFFFIVISFVVFSFFLLTNRINITGINTKSEMFNIFFINIYSCADNWNILKCVSLFCNRYFWWSVDLLIQEKNGRNLRPLIH